MRFSKDWYGVFEKVDDSKLFNEEIVGKFTYFRKKLIGRIQ